MHRLRRISILALAFVLILMAAYISRADAAKPLHKPLHKPGDGSKGTSQMAGGNGRFGVTYTVTDGNGLLLNYTILSAAYQIESGDYTPRTCYAPNSTQKMVEIHYKVKNPQSTDMYYNGSDYLQVVDSQDNIDSTCDGQGRNFLTDGPSNGTLKPGQGRDDLVTYALVPRAGGVSKLILTLGRAGVNEKVIRFPIGVAPNVIAPLPAPYVDPADPTGATALAEIPAKYDTTYTAGFFTVSVSPGVKVTGNLGNDAPDDGKQFVTFLVKLTNASEGQIYVGGEGGVNAVLTDVDGDAIKATGTCYKPVHDDPVDGRMMDRNDTFTYRLAFMVPNNETFQKLKLNTGLDNTGHVSESLIYDASALK